MADYSTLTLRIAAVFAFLSPVTLFIAMGIGMRVGLRPGINLGSAEELQRLHRISAGARRVTLLSLAAPVLALGAGFGWYELLRVGGPLAAYGVLLWYLGMIFVIVNDALELAVLERLPRAFAAASQDARAILLELGATLGRAIELLGQIGGFVSFAGIALIAGAMLQSSLVPAWIGWLGLASALIILCSSVGISLRLPARSLRTARQLGYPAFMVWIIATGAVMWGAATAGA